MKHAACTRVRRQRGLSGEDKSLQNSWIAQLPQGKVAGVYSRAFGGCGQQKRFCGASTRQLGEGFH